MGNHRTKGLRDVHLFIETQNKARFTTHGASMTTETTTPEQTPSLFSKISPEIVKRLQSKGISTPTPIQNMAFQPIVDGHDVIAQSRTGSGKTLAFGLPVFEKMAQHESNGPRILILTPTRELAVQICNVYSELYKDQGFYTLAITGGSSYRFQISTLKKGVDVIVATPGRFVDLMNQKAVPLDSLTTLILDEMDEMLDFGFSEDILKIKNKIDRKVQTLLFSATFPPKVQRMTKQMVQNPVELKVSAAQAEATGNIQHEYVLVRTTKNMEALQILLMQHMPEHGIIFCKTREETKEIQSELLKKGILSGILNGEMDQQERMKTMDKFRKKIYKLLVATDVAARGIDVTGLSHVIHYNVPGNVEAYTHRSGRTGRAGASGKSWTIVAYNQRREYNAICQQLKLTPQLVPVQQFEHFLGSYAGNVLNSAVSTSQESSSVFLKSAKELIAQFPLEQREEALAGIIAQQMERALGKHFEIDQIFSKDKLTSAGNTGGSFPRRNSGGYQGRRDGGRPSRGKFRGQESSSPRYGSRNPNGKPSHRDKPGSNPIKKSRPNNSFIEKKPLSFL